MLEIKEKKVVDVNQKIQLVDGKFSPGEASHVINSLINEKINFHKLQALSWYERNHDADTSHSEKRQKELLEEKITAREYIMSAREQGYDVIIDGVLEIKFVKK